MPETPIYGPGRVPVKLVVNGQTHLLNLLPSETLAEVLRGELGLTGTKVVCGMGDCGACTVWLGSKPVYSCLQLAIDCQSQPITTIEGLKRNGELHPVQQAFIADDAFQCGYCTSGQVMSMAALLERNPDPDEEAIRSAVAGNLCRCGAYPKIVRAGKRAAEMLRVSKEREAPGE
ncbi:MAG: (2Fe-2S)-binding protein [Chloroflexi bacterium]|nr:(2Fe-2S)-binding protein [Chloroflexota bacterium]